jgi:hypothetical protein
MITTATTIAIVATVGVTTTIAIFAGMLMKSEAAAALLILPTVVGASVVDGGAVGIKVDVGLIVVGCADGDGVGMDINIGCP